MRLPAVALFFALALALGACGTRPVAQPAGHIVAETAPARAESSIPAPVRMVPLPPPPEAREPEIRYSVVVANQPVRDVLLAMARETKINFDIHPGIEGSVNLNAIDQTMKQILNRIARQVDMRWEVEGQTITVMPDTPFLRNYRVDYVNMSRDARSVQTVSTQVSGTHEPSRQLWPAEQTTPQHAASTHWPAGQISLGPQTVFSQRVATHSPLLQAWPCGQRTPTQGRSLQRSLMQTWRSPQLESVQSRGTQVPLTQAVSAEQAMPHALQFESLRAGSMHSPPQASSVVPHSPCGRQKPSGPQTSSGFAQLPFGSQR